MPRILFREIVNDQYRELYMLHQQGRIMIEKADKVEQATVIVNGGGPEREVILWNVIANAIDKDRAYEISAIIRATFEAYDTETRPWIGGNVFQSLLENIYIIGDCPDPKERANLSAKELEIIQIFYRINQVTSEEYERFEKALNRIMIGGK